MPIESPWLTDARNSIGQYEDGPDVPKLASEVAKAFPDVPGIAQYCALARNETAWCGIFCAAILSRFGIQPPFDRSNELRSFMWVDAWLNFGEKVAVGQQQPGDLALWLKSPHHISFVAGNGRYIGGNQGNAVTEGSYRTPDAIRRPVVVRGLELEQKVAGRQYGIVATYFGGSSDPNTSAYDGHLISDDELGVALPYRFKGTSPKVRVFKGGKSVDCSIVDVGPWNINDPYWETGSRPQAESGTDNTGRRTNLAGIDLTPAAADAIGLNGKGVVDWEFVKVGEQPEPQPMPEATTLKEILAQLETERKAIVARIDAAVALIKKGGDIANKPPEQKPGVDIIGMIPEALVPVMWPLIQKMTAEQVLTLLRSLKGQKSGIGAGTAALAGAGGGMGFAVLALEILSKLIGGG